MLSKATSGGMGEDCHALVRAQDFHTSDGATCNVVQRSLEDHLEARDGMTSALTAYAVRIQSAWVVLLIQVGHLVEPDACPAVPAMDEEHRWADAMWTWHSWFADEQIKRSCWCPYEYSGDV